MATTFVSLHCLMLCFPFGDVAYWLFILDLRLGFGMLVFDFTFLLGFLGVLMLVSLGLVCIGVFLLGFEVCLQF